MTNGEEQGTRKLAAIMFTDIRGFSRKMGENETVAMALLRAHDAMMRELVEKHGGRVIKSIGDSFMVDFSSAVNAVKCAVEAQQIFWYYNKGKTELDKIEIRIGIHLGDVISDGRDIYGDGVNVASRIEAITQPNRICISQDIYNQVKNKMPIQAFSLGLAEFKNIAEPIEVYEVLIESIPELSKPSQSSLPAKAPKKAEVDTRKEAEEAQRVEEVKQRTDEGTLLVEQEQQKKVQGYYAEAERLFNAGKLEEAEAQISEIFKVVALHAGAQLLQMKIEEVRFQRSEEERIRKMESQRREAQERDERIQKLLEEAGERLTAGAFDEALTAARGVLELDPDNERAAALEKEILESKTLQEAIQAEQEAEQQVQVEEPVSVEEAAPEQPKPRKALRTAAEIRAQRERQKHLRRIMLTVLVAAAAVIGLILALPSIRLVMFPRSNAVAVLPFQMLTGSADRLTVGSALGALVADDLSRYSQLTVIAAPSTYAARQAGLTNARVAEEFQVGFVVTGDVQEREDGTTWRVWLLDMETGKPRWNETFNITPTSLPDIRKAVVSGVLKALDLEIPLEPTSPLTFNPNALRLYFKGWAGILQQNEASVRQGMDSLVAAFAIDSSMGPAAAALGEGAMHLFAMGGETDFSLLRQAADFSQLALRIQPGLADAYETLAAIYRNRQRSREAEQALDHAMTLRPATAECYRQLALLHLMDADYDGALSDAQKAVRLDPRNPDSYQTLGLAQHFLGSFGEALRSYGRAISLGAPDSLLSMRYRIGAWIASGQSDQAIAYTQGILDRYRRDYRSYYWVGQAYQLGGRALDGQKFLKAGRELVDDVLERNEHNTDAHVYRALFLSRLGEFAEATTEIDGVLSQNPNSSRMMYRKASVFAIQNKRQDALQWIQKAATAEFLPAEILAPEFAFFAKSPEFTDMLEQAAEARSRNDQGSR